MSVLRHTSLKLTWDGFAISFFIFIIHVISGGFIYKLQSTTIDIKKKFTLSFYDD